MDTRLRKIWEHNHMQSIDAGTNLFNHFFNTSKTYINNEDTASFQAVEKVLHLHGKRLKTSYIYALCGFDKDLLESALNDFSQTDLVSMIYAQESEALQDLGFEVVVEETVYNIPSVSLPELKVDGIVLDPKSDDLEQVYNAFSAHFTGYFTRTSEFFDILKHESRRLKGGFVGYSSDDQLKGYARYINHGSYVEVVECCYDTSGTLLKLLSFVSRGMQRIILHTSSQEKISKLLPNVKKEQKAVIMARINDPELFERLFHIRIISAYSAFHAFGKPIRNFDKY